MVRHTNKRKNTRRRRQTRGRRTQKGGFSFSDLFGSSDDVNALEQELINEKDPTKIAEIKKKIALAKVKKQYDKDVEQIKKGSAAESNMGNQKYGNQEYDNQNQNLDSRQSGYSGNPRELDGTRQFGDNNNALNTWQSGGSRRRHRRHRRK